MAFAVGGWGSDVPGLATQLLGLVVLVIPLLAIQWNLAGNPEKRRFLAPRGTNPRWRLEVYSNHDDAITALVDPADVPYPVKRVRSAKAAQASFDPEKAWTLPRLELDVEVTDPFTNDALAGLLGVDHRVRFVTGNEAVVDARRKRLRIRAFRFN